MTKEKIENVKTRLQANAGAVLELYLFISCILTNNNSLFLNLVISFYGRLDFIYKTKDGWTFCANMVLLLFNFYSSLWKLTAKVSCQCKILKILRQGRIQGASTFFACILLKITIKFQLIISIKIYLLLGR